MVEVLLASALICFQGECHPALVGKDTNPGSYTLAPRITKDPGYGGDVLQYDRIPGLVYAIHRVWTLNPSQRRVERLQSSNPSERQNVTNGCVNVMPDVYDKLRECCSHSTLVIKQE